MILKFALDTFFCLWHHELNWKKGLIKNRVRQDLNRALFETAKALYDLNRPEHKLMTDNIGSAEKCYG